MIRMGKPLRRGCALLLCWLWAGGGLGGPPALAQANDAAGAPNSRIEAVGQLIQHSSAAAQVANSGEAAAIAKHKAAEELYGRAVEAQRRGDADGATRLAAEASRTMFEAVRLAKPEAVTGEKKRADFNKRFASLKQLLQAFERVRQEKQSEVGRAEVDGPLKEKLARATSLFEAGRLDEARASLDEAYTLAATAMQKLHGGDTVTRSLHFSSKGEEYRYELDRNDTHRMLLTGLLAEKSDRPELQQQTQPFVERAAELRQQAESVAASGGYDRAIEMLNDSTAQLVRAIRAAGLYLPG